MVSTASLSLPITQREVAKICNPLVHRIKSCLNEFMNKEEVKDFVIDEVVLAGGSSRLPLFQEAVKEVTGLNPKAHLNPDLLIAQGAAFVLNCINKESQFNH